MRIPFRSSGRSAVILTRTCFAWIFSAAMFGYGAIGRVDGQEPFSGGPANLPLARLESTLEPPAVSTNELAVELMALRREVQTLRELGPGASAAAANQDAVGAAAGPIAARNTAPAGAAAASPTDASGGLQSQFDTLYDKARSGRYPNLTVNGVFQADVAFFQQDASSVASFGDIQDGASFRRARLSAKGAVTETVNYFFQTDFAFFGRPTITDLWMETTDLPVLGNFRVGQWKQPFSLEVVSSFRYTTFMERSLLFGPFTPFRHLGMGFYDHSDDLSMTWAASGFRSGQDQFGGSISDDGGWGTAERVTWLPWYDEASGGRGYLHLGLGHFYSNPPNDCYNFRTIPEIYVGENAPGVVGTSGVAAPGAFNGTPFFAQTNNVLANGFHVLGAELLWVLGEFSFQSEAMVAFVDQTNGVPATLAGAYAQVGYFLTGEHRPYDRGAGAIDRVKPFENFFRVRAAESAVQGRGAWELAFRCSYVDLNDMNIQGGQLTDLTAGLNWYWNAYTKLQFNYIHAFADHPTQGDSDTRIYAARAQIDF